MKHILFNNATSSDGTTPGEGGTAYGSVADKTIALFNADNIGADSLDLTTAATNVSNFIIVQAGPSNELVFRTPILARENIERVKTTTYVAPVKQSTTIALASISVSAGEEYTVKVVDVTNGYEPYPVQTVSYTAKTGDNASAVAAGLRAAFTNHPRSLVEVSGATTNVILTGAFPSLQTQEGISITSSPLAQSFSTSLSESLAGATFTPTPTAPLFGTGTYNHVRYLEENSQAGQGFLYRMTPFQAEKPVFYSDPALTYDLVSILYRTNTTPNIAKSNKYVEYILAYEAGTLANDSVDWEAVFGF
jgi:hypothetical protein